ncbi:ras-related protein Rab-13-like [Amphiura filiformis]|uniref:ras-related protein Rab-13-like n=1 Tax=Amphiura filiformis TaxID=82378 RepID=UPI003B21FE79
MAKQYDILVRLLMIGDSGVGKTCMLCRFTEEGFIQPHLTTIGIDFKMKNMVLDDKRIKVQVWDTAGQERYNTITAQYFRRAQGIMVIYDITSETSFLNSQKWLRMVSENGCDDIEKLLVGNKSDAKSLRTVSREEGQKFADHHEMGFIETSAHSDTNIEEAFTVLVKQVMRKRKKSIDRQMANIRLYNTEDSIDLADESLINKDKSLCC